MKEAEKEKQELQQEPPVGEYMDQVKCCHDTDCTKRMMMKGLTALKMQIGKNTKMLSERSESHGMVL